ncbi:alpha/beta-hydrolase [Myriangium duriaei CBS 260.36]|uniref:Carboxylic ester hydrolase n=1 Tax=Myriangium duriaei CBS 260.36 TaxID=1168546 RepID=A0A9P4MIA4_9PEZI|nr:alpha/beta-hydrolase [Myriangium duriaei CBS 260.36]
MKVAWVHLAPVFNLVASVLGSDLTTSPIVDLGYAKFQGKANPNWDAISYFGLRYASPPVGQWRFRAPQPIENGTFYKKSSVIDATTRGPTCIQGATGLTFTATTPVVQQGAEDCLLLDILVPIKPIGSNLPVLVQIHGGGYSVGNSQTISGNALIKHSQSIIYVSIQYRLNVFGFLSGAELKKNGDANAGLLDQRLALEWVQQHIRRFGGDPHRVTIVGGSAGGGSIMNQMIMYGGKSSPPFRAAISQFPWWTPFHNDTYLEKQYDDLLGTTKCKDLACLRTLSSRALHSAALFSQAAAYLNHDYGYGSSYWAPSVDGTYIQDLPSNEFKNGNFVKVPLLVDHEQNEGYLFTNQSETTLSQETADLKTLFPAAKQSFFSQLYNLYPSSKFSNIFWQREQIFGDFMINCPTYYMAIATSKLGIPTWKMNFDAGTTYHASIDPFLYGTKINSNSIAIGNVMKDWILSFAINLDPNVKSFTQTKKPYWPQYQGNSTTMIVQPTTFKVQKDSDASPQCTFWQQQSAALRN